MNIEILEIAAKTISISGKEDCMEGARLVVAILTLVVTILIFVLERQHGKKEEFFTLYAKFIANENAQKACRIIENGDHQAHLSSDKYLIQLDQFLMFMNALLCLADSRPIRKHCLKVIRFELNLIASNKLLCEDINMDKNGLTALKEYINGKK